MQNGHMSYECEVAKLVDRMDKQECMLQACRASLDHDQCERSEEHVRRSVQQVLLSTRMRDL
jgi:hypothetical protein